MLGGGGLHPDAVGHLEESVKLIQRAERSWFGRRGLIREAIQAQESARTRLIGGGK